jgi:hypothetical protein
LCRPEILLIAQLLRPLREVAKVIMGKLPDERITMKKTVGMMIIATVGALTVPAGRAQAGYSYGNPCGGNGYMSNWRPTANTSKAVTDGGSCYNHTHADSSGSSSSGVAVYTENTVYGTPGSSAHHAGYTNSGVLVYY